MNLYKYCGPHLTSTIASGSIRFTPPHVFNDPFELKPHITAVVSESQLNDTYDRAVKKAIAEGYDNLDKKTKKLTTRKEFAAMLTEQYRKQKLFLPDIANRTRDEITGVLDKEFKNYGMLCLTQNPDSLLMWAHYADSHKGFVIEFDHNSNFFNQKPNTKSHLRRLHDVTYAQSRPSMLLGDIKEFSIFLTKSIDWAYEMEKRMLIPLSEADRVINIKGEDIHLFNFPKSAVKSVILGCRMSTTDEQDIRNIISNDEDYAHVEIKKASVHPSDYKIEIS